MVDAGQESRIMSVPPQKDRTVMDTLKHNKVKHTLLVFIAFSEDK